MTMTVKQVHPLFVGEVAGIKLSADLDEATIDALKKAIDDYAVLVFHGQDFDDDGLLAFGRRFGSMAAPRNHRAERRLKHGEIADISNLNAKGGVRDRSDHRRLDSLANQLWHSDASFRPISGELSMLYAHVVPPVGGDTEFADLRAAYDALDDGLKAEIGGLIAEHSIFHSRGLLGHTDYTEVERAALPDVRHPLVRTHPGSGRKTLYMGAHAAHIIGWPIPEGRLLLRDLMDHATERRFVHAHAWQPGDLVIWDNRCTLHRGRRYDDAAYKRDLRRVTTQDMTSAADNPGLAAAT
ncbi:MAG: TauD/TfdA family dioxygenase [Alphaproteobacteria bacterium]|nr:TauD/TfdA family dioxygenase [Alphaproteobacteria bacterium]